MEWKKTALTMVGACAFAVGLVGCSGTQDGGLSTEQRLFEGVTTDEKALAQSILDSSGIDGKVQSISKINEQSWAVNYSPTTKTGKMKGGAQRPPSLTINPKTGKVTSKDGAKVR
jgi:hypothetical protein